MRGTKDLLQRLLEIVLNLTSIILIKNENLKLQKLIVGSSQQYVIYISNIYSLYGLYKYSEYSF